MTEGERDSLLAECLEEYHRRRARGEGVTPDQWRARAGSHYGAFLEIVAAESAIDELIEPPPVSENLPRSFGEYTLLSVLGRGAMGIVYEAVHRILGRKVALKVLRTGFEGEPLALERFRREARACAQVRHDHIVTIHDAGQVDGQPWYSMDLLEGCSLADLIRGDVPPAPARLAEGLADIADALHVLHEEGIVHRDVKPGNIFVTTSGRMILADFGIARTAMAQTLTQTGQRIGTPLYMSPEQVLGRSSEIDGRSDVFGLGATMYESLGRRPPFDADDYSEVTRMIVTERPRPLSELAPELPADCIRVVMKALEKRKEDRYATAAAMRDDLRALAAGRPVQGRPVSELRHRLRRHRRPLIAAAFVLIAVAAGLVWHLNRPTRFHVRSFPPGDVFVDGVAAGLSPVVIDLASGKHEVRIRLEGFETFRDAVVLERGRTERLTVPLRLADSEDPVGLGRLAAEFGGRLPGLAAPERDRGPADTGPVRVLLPRGPVRADDLGEYVTELADPMSEADGTIRFLRGDEELARVPYEPALGPVRRRMPDAVAGAVAAGDEIRWGFFPERGAPVTVDFRVVPDPVADRIARIDAEAAEQPAAARRHLRAAAWLSAGLTLAAFHEAERAAEANPDSARARLTALRALDRMGLADTDLRARALEAYDRLPDSAKRGVVAADESD